MPKYLVIEPLGYDRPATYMPGETVDMLESEAECLIESGVIGNIGEGRSQNVAKTVELVKAAPTLEALEELKKNSSKREDVTPETLSAAYARISRDPRPINELRKAAREEVEKALKELS